MKLLTERRAGLKRIAASTGDGDLVIFRMNFLFHCNMSPCKVKTNSHIKLNTTKKSRFGQSRSMAFRFRIGVIRDTEAHQVFNFFQLPVLC